MEEKLDEREKWQKTKQTFLKKTYLFVVCFETTGFFFFALRETCFSDIEVFDF